MGRAGAAKLFLLVVVEMGGQAGAAKFVGLAPVHKDLCAENRWSTLAGQEVGTHIGIHTCKRIGSVVKDNRGRSMRICSRTWKNRCSRMRAQEECSSTAPSGRRSSLVGP